MRSRVLVPLAAGVACLATAVGLALVEYAGEPGPAGPVPGVVASPSDDELSVALPTTSPDDVLDDPTPVVTPSVPPLPADRADVVADLLALLADPEHDTKGPRAVVVLDEYGRPLVEQNPELGLLPASSMKLVTAAAALELHGSVGRIATPVLLDGEVTPGGTLLGDVVLLASGDPTLTTAAYRRFIYPARPSTDLAQVADLLRVAGVERVAGDVVADPGPYADQRIPSGWRDVYLQDFDGRNITGLTVDAGLSTRIAYPPERWPALTDEQVEDGLTLLQSRDPLVHAAAEAHRAIVAAGIPVEGTSRAGQASTDAVVVGSLRSPRMRDVLSFMVKQSDNHLADTLFREVGAAVTGHSTWASSADATRLLLADLGVDSTGAVLADGSGLSRDDQLTARLLAQLDLALTAGEHGLQWAGFQAIAGEDGTLRRRLVGTIAAGRLRGKTGTLTDVRALAGAVEGPDGARYHLAVLANGGEVWRANTLVDAIAIRLAESLWCPVAQEPGMAVEVVVHCRAAAEREAAERASEAGPSEAGSSEAGPSEAGASEPQVVGAGA